MQLAERHGAINSDDKDIVRKLSSRRANRSPNSPSSPHSITSPESPVFSEDSQLQKKQPSLYRARSSSDPKSSSESSEPRTKSRSSRSRSNSLEIDENVHRVLAQEEQEGKPVTNGQVSISGKSGHSMISF